MKVCFITGTRADYGLLKPLIDELKKDDFFEIQIIASGMHLSPEFGMTYKEIEADGLKINEKIEMLLSSDTPVGISKSMGLGMISFAETYQRLKPDLIVGLGDRFELFSAVSAAMVSKIPVAHLHGGELTYGAYDEGFRHAITKMSHIHFTSTEIYRRRVIQLGENPKNVFNVGALGLDNIKNLKLLSKSELQSVIKFNLDKPYFVITFHPVTLENKTSKPQFKELLNALDKFISYKLLFTLPNADNDGRIIIEHIKEYVCNNPERACYFTSLGRLNYLSAIKYAEMLIGNSSSGIIEMPGFKKPTINIGDRQKGRIFPNSIIQANPTKESIFNAMKKGLKKDFLDICRKQNNVYGNGHASIRIKNILRKISLDQMIKKTFFDFHYQF